MKKVLLTDVDGTFLDFRNSFMRFCKDKRWISPEYKEHERMHQIMGWTPELSDAIVAEYSESSFGATCELHSDAIFAMNYLKETGWDIIAITKWHDSDQAIENRLANISEYFGFSFFKEVHCIGLKGDKRPLLNKYVNEYDIAFWVEDHVKWAQVGAEEGATSFLLDRGYNTAWEGLDVFRVKNWLEVCKHAKRLES